MHTCNSVVQRRTTRFRRLHDTPSLRDCTCMCPEQQGLPSQKRDTELDL